MAARPGQRQKVETVRNGVETYGDALGALEALRHFALRPGQCRRGLPRVNPQRHDAFMRMPWHKSKDAQLDFAAEQNTPHRPVEACARSEAVPSDPVELPPNASKAGVADGRPMLVAVSLLYEDANNPRTEFPEAAQEELAMDIQQRGVLQPLVVHPADGEGRHCIHFGAKRLRAAMRAGLHEVPVVVRDLPADRYAQVAENQKRHGLTPLDLARFIRGRVDAGDSNATVARRLGMNLTTVAHHIALLELPPELDEAMKSGRVTSPRTLHELSNLHAEQPDQVRALLSSGAELTRSQVSAWRTASMSGRASDATLSPANKLVKQLNDACDRMERALSRMTHVSAEQAALPELIALRIRVEGLIKYWQQGSDRQTPPPS